MANNNRNIAAGGVFHYSSTQESTNIDGFHLDHNTGSPNIDEDSSVDSKEYLEIAMANALLAWAKESKAKTDAILMERFKSRSINADYSLTKCVNVLNEIEDITDHVYMKALEKFKDPDWREMFLSMSSDRRKGWLVRL
ncbi:uncharacterized protein [Cicer arietinum]|uniref:Uncharacterized protein LOC105851237 n=1 Tax=Cicer arietinum TaxID=3827 RepID=A0A1S3DWU0_CICAR|nr:uncharacterized protein LOC105851237 [Cicer arietinum]